ncbi:helix-turn-helix transcriptional regulator [Alicyclobacillus macrosporangiidus]|uniref:Regulatory protein, luxR family n=1 Tax=Alicyclobacillus macrosporangiidus TaxID=392015 RepID=A0A1I7IGC7_9BACL|nr:LuxR family transcriptional regulator [Alicyclobacillus macrosporangiidus]SFU71981.1 regulatory protein, luxR family [Alicyclobacillus macrosporangiidus]
MQARQPPKNVCRQARSDLRSATACLHLFQRNPSLFDTADGIASRLGREGTAVARALEDLVRQSRVWACRVSGLTLYAAPLRNAAPGQVQESGLSYVPGDATEAESGRPVHDGARTGAVPPVAAEVAVSLEAAGVPPRVALTEREREVLSLAGQGYTNREIARKLHISAHTVKNHMSSIFRKLGIRDRRQLLLARHDRLS